VTYLPIEHHGLGEQRRQRLLEITDRCPVHHMLESEILVETRLAE
jgi:uncharacterized OsmC-like protein